jgi:membrane protease YdiL (CAAX protease family)
MYRIMKTSGRIIAAVVLGVIVLGISSSMAFAISRQFPGLDRSLPMGEGFVVQVGILLLSVLLILAVSKGELPRYGFKIGKNIQLLRIVILGLVVGFASSLTELAAPGNIPQPACGSIFDLIIGVWILASVAEEVLTRGLIQGFLSPLTGLAFSLGGCVSAYPS